MKLIRKYVSIIIVTVLLATLMGCSDSSNKTKENIDAYMKNMESLTLENYVGWVNENLNNPYSSVGLDLEQLKEGQIAYFVKCLSKIKYEIIKVDETNKTVEVKVEYIDSTEYISNLFSQLMSYAFSEDYTEEGENQIYFDVIDSVTEDKFVEDTICFSLNDDLSINNASSNTFDVVTAGIYRIMLGDVGGNQEGLSEAELLENLEVNYEVLNVDKIFVSITNNNDVPVYPVIDFVFSDKEGNNVIYSQASIEALPAGATNHTVAYNELNDEIVNFEIEKHIAYYDLDDITFIDESLVPYEISNKNREDEIDIIFTNNTEDTVYVCGCYIVYDENDNVVDADSIYLSEIEPGQSSYTWFYLDRDYDEKTDTITYIPYGRVEVYPIIHTYADYTWAN